MANTPIYFSHDANARTDSKILNVRRLHGAEGYGIYFMIIERLRSEPDYISAADYNAIAFDLRVGTDKVKSVINDFGLFAFTDDGERFYSESLLRRMSKKDKVSAKRSEAGKEGAAARWGKSENTAENDKAIANAIEKNGKQGNLPSEKMAKHGKEKQSKEKQRKEKQKIDSGGSACAREVDPPDDSFVIPGNPDDGWQAIQQAYESDIGLISRRAHDAILEFLQQGIEPLLIVRAIECAADQGKRSWAYINGILTNLSANNIKSVAAFDIEQKKYEQRKTQRNGRSGASNRGNCSEQSDKFVFDQDWSAELADIF